MSDQANDACGCGSFSRLPSDELGSGGSGERLFWRPSESPLANPVVPSGVAVTATGYRPLTLPSGFPDSSNAGTTPSSYAYRPGPSGGARISSGSGTPTGLLATSGTPFRSLPDRRISPERSLGYCCISAPQLNLDSPFKCRRTVRGYFYDKPLPDSPGIPLPSPEDDRMNAVLDKKTAGPVVSPEGKRYFLYEAWCELTLKGPCNCLVRQSFEIEQANTSLLDELHLTIRKYHSAHKEVNADYNGEPLRQHDKFEDYTQNWFKCCSSAQSRDRKSYVALVDAPGGFSRKSTGILLFSIVFYSNRTAPKPPCTCWVAILQFRLFIGQTKTGQSSPGALEYAELGSRCDPHETLPQIQGR